MAPIIKETANYHSHFDVKATLNNVVDKRRLDVLSILSPTSKSDLGQYMTAHRVAEFMASLYVNTSQLEIKLLDPGAGVGSLTASFVQRVCSEPNRPQHISITAYEIDPKLTISLHHTLADCYRVAKAAGVQVNYRIMQEDFIKYTSEALRGGFFVERSNYTHVIMNPPYKKIQSMSLHRKLLRCVGVEATNLYSAFVALAIKLLSPNGELVAITPRSFANGPYFLPFRKLLLAETSIRQIHTLEARDDAFRDDKVLQENIIYHLIKKPQSPQVVITSSRGSNFCDISRKNLSFTDIIHSGDGDLIIHIPTKQEDIDIIRRVRVLTHSLDDLGITVSTGPVVDFRLREFLHKDITPLSVPLVYPAHFQKGMVVWPKPQGKKPNSIDNLTATRKWLFPTGYYTLTRRFSSKEEKRRIMAAIFDPQKVVSDWVGFENHLNVFHVKGGGLTAVIAQGLAVYLNSTIVDKFFRLFNGNTQVNATDLRLLPYPSQDELIMLGENIGTKGLPSQGVIDELIEKIIFSQKDTNYS